MVILLKIPHTHLQHNLNIYFYRYHTHPIIFAHLFKQVNISLDDVIRASLKLTFPSIHMESKTEASYFNKTIRQNVLLLWLDCSFRADLWTDSGIPLCIVQFLFIPFFLFLPKINKAYFLYCVPLFCVLSWNFTVYALCLNESAGGRAQGRHRVGSWLCAIFWLYLKYVFILWYATVFPVLVGEKIIWSL